MAYLVGMDEAGYGPNLGPLVISATVWQVNGEPGAVDLYDALADVAARTPDRRRIAIADSKQLYKPQGSLGLLERGVLSALAVAGREVTDWPSLCDALEADPDGRRHRLPWYDGYQLPLPVAIDAQERERLASVFDQGLCAAGVRLLSVRSTAVFPEEFNALIDSHGNKATALSKLSLQLLGRMLKPLDDGPVLAVCDKHGGRNRYGKLLREQFPGERVEVIAESGSESIYRVKKGTGLIFRDDLEVASKKRAASPFLIRFARGGEASLPVALASMTSKYLRELAMRALNDYWKGHVESLRPTAGYPVDARRFKARPGWASPIAFSVETARILRCVGPRLSITIK